MITELVIFPEVRWKLVFELREARFDRGDQLYHVMVGCDGQSHVTAIMLTAAEAEEASWSSEVGVCGGSWQRLPARRRCPGLLKGNWAVDLVVAATSSGSSILSGLVDPVGWQDKASVAKCFTSGMWTILKR